jgi:hypothetical protein
MNRLLSSVALSTIFRLVPLAVVLLAIPSVSAQTVVINHADRGWYTITGQQSPLDTNYKVGDRYHNFLYSIYRA